MNNRSSRGFVLAALTFISLGAIGVVTQDFGFFLTLGVPFASGLVLGRWVRVRRALQIVCALALLTGLVVAAIIAKLAGLLCGLIAGVIFGGPLILGVLAGSMVYGGRGSGEIVACIAAIAVFLPIEGFLPEMRPEETVVTQTVVPISAVDAFDRFRFYESVDHPRDLLLSLALPIPIGTEALRGSGGGLVRCIYESGYLVKRVRASLPGQLYAFDIVEQKGVEERSVRLTGGSVRFEELGPNVVRITMATRYRPLLSARIIWRPFEAAVIRALHKHVLQGMVRAAA